MAREKSKNVFHRLHPQVRRYLSSQFPGTRIYVPRSDQDLYRYGEMGREPEWKWGLLTSEIEERDKQIRSKFRDRRFLYHPDHRQTATAAVKTLATEYNLSVRQIWRILKADSDSD